MNHFLSNLWYQKDVESNAAVCSIVYLRLLMLSLVTLFLLFWSLLYQPYPSWEQTGIVFLLTTVWSVIVLKRKTLQRSDWSEVREILVDISWVFAIVFISGRTTNPFIYYYLVLIAIAATLLSSKRAWSLCGLCIFLYSAMLLIDLKDHFNHFSNDYKIHLVGMWVNYVGSSVIICFFVSKLIKILHKQQDQMTDIRENNLKNEQLIGLATVSASTVHNLATPLSTLTILIDDVADNNDLKSNINQDLEIMREQIIRCQNTMQELSNLAKRSDEKTVQSINELVNDLNEHFALHHPETKPEIAFGLEQNYFIECSPLFEYAIINLINNAMESTSHKAIVDISVLQGHLNIAIKNDFEETLDKASKDSVSKRWGQLSSSDKEIGLGIGSLLANSTIERQGGTVKLEILTIDEGLEKKQVIVTIRFPLVQTTP